MATTDKRHEWDPVRDRLEAVFECALTAYHRDELHGGARWVGERVLDAELVPIAREAYLDADDLPAEHDVLQVFDGEPMQLLGEGYHVITLIEQARRFVVKYAKTLTPVPPLAPSSSASRPEWERDYGVRPDGSLHPAIWQHIRAFEAYGPLAVPSRIYIADSAVHALCADERRALERFRAIGIVRSLGLEPRPLRVTYPDDFPDEKRASNGLEASVVVLQPVVVPLSAAIARSLRAGDVEAARDLEARYHEFTRQLWRCGVSHLDFSILNIGIVGSGPTERLQIFDPHMGAIDLAEGAVEVRDPMTVDASAERSVDRVLRSSRDGSRWALWRVQQDMSASEDVPPQGADAAAALVRDFHAASEGLEEGRGSFGFAGFDQEWQQRRTHSINTVMHAQLWALVRHPLAELVASVLEPATPDTVYDRALPVLGMHDDCPLAQFRAGLKVYENRPLILVANVSDGASKFVKHWGRVQLAQELDVQDDPAIHYHLRDLFTGEVYVRPGDDLVRRGLVVGLAMHELHVLQVEDISLADRPVERTLAVHRNISEFLKDCTKRVGVVGDVHGELQALEEVLRALDFIDSKNDWCARDGTLVFTGDVGHGRHLQEVFDFIHRLAAQAHGQGGRIVWTLGNHDLYVDREGGQGGEQSMGYRLWPTIREAALHPERHPGLSVQAAYFEHGKLFVHGGILPNIVELTMRDRGARDAETVASYVNDVLRRTLVERERISAQDLPHEIFHIGTSHTREKRMPGEIGYEPAGVFTPDLRELDHYRYHAELLPQIVGHTASQRGEIRYSPGSWLRRDYIAIDVGRQHGRGNGGLLLTDFGWVAVTPGGPARLVEVTPLFVELAREGWGEPWREEHGETLVKRMISAHFEVAKPETTFGRVQESVFADLSPAQVVVLERFMTAIRQSGRSTIVTDLNEMLTAFSRGPLEEDTVDVLAAYLGAGGVLVFSTHIGFEWFYVRLLRPLVMKLGPRSPLLASVLLILSGGTEIYALDDGGYRLLSRAAERQSAAAFDALTALSKQGPVHHMPELDPARSAYIGDSRGPAKIDRGMAHKVGNVIDVGDAMIGPPHKPMTSLRRGYDRAIDVIGAATVALRESNAATLPPSQPEVGDTVLWTFERPHFPRGRRVRVRVRGSGFVHAGVAGPKGAWSPVYNVPLVPLPEGGYEAVLPSGVNAFTFFWTEAPWSPGVPGHWEGDRAGARVFVARGR
ncbi:MAG TPA: metallophosphoesterase [Vicinamibacterales bacterium]|nr:metallophosphoesterase [Vicinamibacterales bacterium]